MNKKLVSLAVAAALVAPAAAMADATMYGKLHVSIDYQDVKTLVGDEDKFKGWGLNGNNSMVGAPRSSRFGIKGSEDLGNGLKAIYQVEFGVKLSDNNFTQTRGDEQVTMRNSFVGLAGGWGTFLVGRHDTPLKISTGKLDMFADTMADYNGTIGFSDIRADSAIAYISPSFSGFQIAAAVVPGGGGTINGTENRDSDSLAEGWSLAGIYKNGPFYGSIAYESMGKQLGTNDFEVGTNGDLFANVTAVGLAPVSGYVEVLDADGNPTGTYEDAPGTANLPIQDADWKKWRIGLGILDWNGFSLTGIYENWENGPYQGVFVNDNDRDLWQIQAGYAFGNNMIKGMYGSMDRDTNPDKARTLGGAVDRFLADADRSSWAIAFDHNFSKRTKAYALYTDTDDDIERDWSGFSLGMIHSF